jgi:NAD kinase
MFENSIVVYKDKLSQRGYHALDTFLGILDRRNIKHSLTNVAHVEKDSFIGKDCAFALGGDGTILSVARYVLDIPILGINIEPWDSIGHLDSLEGVDIWSINEIFNGNYRIIERQRAKTVRNGQVLEERALNEVRVGVEKMRDCAHYIVKFREIEEEHRSWGIVIATGTGSTGLFRSLGGEEFSYDEEKLCYKVIAGIHGRLYQPKLIQQGEIKKGEVIRFQSKRYHGGEVCMDSRASYTFNNGDLVEVCISDKPLKVILAK